MKEKEYERDPTGMKLPLDIKILKTRRLAGERIGEAI